ncbi:hypothetical protein [Flavobacterium taihuense]|uniref:Uncharacterized protein n=1 Tax=Flavobacterium taihuense TaxID=2857508 RepID=A0ABS6XTU2_9FLAO|nr:hypothetical protein [Flavobacterium taihuense]MBW4360113.1 hypothetical protein [Flavobacterium taihuense]
MKKIITLFTVLLSTMVFSQEITTKKGLFFAEGKQLSNKEVKTLLASNTKALALFKASKTKASVGGFLLGFGGGLVLADLVSGAIADIKYPTALTYVGLASLAASIPVLSGRTKKRNDALALYNEGLKKSATKDSNFELNIIVNQSGYGLQFQF